MSTPPPEKFIVFLFVQEAGGERRLCGFASGGCVACSGRLRRNCTKYQATMLSCSASSGKPDSNSPDCIVAWYFVWRNGGSHHLSNTLLICSTGKFKSSASLSTSVIFLERVLINSSVTRFVTSSSCS